MNKKQVRFNTVKYIHIVPYLTEYISPNELWWSKKDQTDSIISAQKEVKNLISMHKSMKLKEALKVLYQPNNITYN